MVKTSTCLYRDDPQHPDDVCAICAPVWTRAKWELAYRWDRLWRWSRDKK